MQYDNNTISKKKIHHIFVFFNNLLVQISNLKIRIET